MRHIEKPARDIKVGDITTVGRVLDIRPLPEAVTLVISHNGRTGDFSYFVDHPIRVEVS